jgi:response regulator RpfG family c-di-GMP phosphodiesterase
MRNQKVREDLFILIDDDDTNNMISRLVIQGARPNADVLTFSNPIAALKYVRDELIHDRAVGQEIIMLLNIHMPSITGWEFLAQFEAFSDEIKSLIKVYILSASLDVRDEEMARDNTHVIDFLSKPLTTEMVLKIYSI